MNDEIRKSTVDRRTLVTGAAWSVPVMAMAVASPMAAASAGNSALSWAGTTTNLLTLNLLDEGGTLTAGIGITVPNTLRLVNGAGAISGSAVITITVDRPTPSFLLPLTRARSFGVYSAGEVVQPEGSRTTSYVSAGGQDVGYPITTWTATQTLTLAGNATFDLPIEWGLAGTTTGIFTLGLLQSFPVTATVVVGGVTLTATTSILLPLGAGLLGQLVEPGGGGIPG